MAPRLRFLVKLVGIIVFDNAVVQDDIDRAYGFVVLTPALIRETLAVSPAVAAPISYGLQLRHADLTTVEQQIVRLLPKNATVEFHVTSRVVTEVELALKPESVALGGFGAIAALVCLILGIQAISRQLRWTEDDRWVMRALGAGPTAAGGDGLIGALGAAGLGSLVALLVAVGLSPLAPLGPVRPFYPDPGLAFDWTVLGGGLGVIVAVTGTSALVLSSRGARRRAVRAPQGAPRSSSIARSAEAAGMPVASVIGLRFALQPERDRGAVPVRSVLGGTVLAIVVVVAALTFASSLQTLVSHPPLVRLELELRPRPDQQRPAPNLADASARPRRRRLGRVRLQQRRDRRPDDSRPLRTLARRRRRPRRFCPVTDSTPTTRSSSARPPWQSCTSMSATACS